MRPCWTWRASARWSKRGWAADALPLPAAFLDELRARTPIAAVIGRRVKLVRSGRDWKGACPFHGEKTPSFYVYPDHFHCFGCGAHGDAISFVMQSQGASFPEAVEQLASEAGLEVPRPTPEAAEAERRRHDLNEVLAAAAAAYQRRLLLPEGRAALDYLLRRGLTEEIIRRFGLGWSGEGRGALAAELGRDGIGRDLLLEAGLMRPSDDPGGPAGPGGAYDLFFNRVMFPIRDRRGRIISFGGRTLGDGQPKYVNGPETPLFSKRRTLYALDLAREAVRAGAALVVVEGYMDVIALHQSGFGGTVAPLGTALTAEHLEELWRLSPNPVLCFDGDTAGARAAARAAEVALPLIAPDRTLTIASLPAGEDPDTLVRRQGRAGFEPVLNAGKPLAQALFDLLREGAGEATPEQRAALRIRLEDATRRIQDKALAYEYRSVLLDRFFASRPRGGRRSPPPRPVPPRTPCSLTEADRERARILTAILLRHPALLRVTEHVYADLDLPPALAGLRDALSDYDDGVRPLDSANLISHLKHLGLAEDAARVLSFVPMPLPSCASENAMPAEAAAGWWHYFGLMAGADRLDEEVATLQRELAGAWDGAKWARLASLCAVRNRIRGGDLDADEPIQSVNGVP